MFGSKHSDGGGTAMSSEEVIALYEKLSRLTRQMLAAARSRDWDTLQRLQQDGAAEIDAISCRLPALSGELRARKVRLLQAILADDREIRAITEPWMEQAALD